MASKAQIVGKVRKLALSFPDALEKASHGSPGWFIGKKQFCAHVDNHHGDGNFALWLAAPDGAQKMLIDSDSESYFRPAYVGHLGWIGVRLDKTPWDQVAALIESAYRVRAGKKQLAALDQDK